MKRGLFVISNWKISWNTGYYDDAIMMSCHMDRVKG